jgi:hypothetical protein
MPKVVADWEWEEAFDKHGFNDGDGLNFTDEVAEAVEELGYRCVTDPGGMHNYRIVDVLKDGKSAIGPEAYDMFLDYPREVLPPDIVEHLDRKFPEEQL